MKGKLILIVDDEPRYLKLLKYNLESVGCQVVAAATGKEALTAAASQGPDLILLDLKLPDMDGYEVCQRIKEFSAAPIIMVTAKGEVTDKVRGLKLGADDYVTKPFSAEELLARVAAALRRSQLLLSPPLPSQVTFGELTLDRAERRLTKRGQEIELTPTEYQLLLHLAANAGRTMTPQEIQEKVWGPEYREHYEGLRTYIRRLRQKIEPDSEHPRYILTKHGVGYMFRREASPAGENRTKEET